MELRKDVVKAITKHDNIIGNVVKINYFDPLCMEMSSECFNVTGIYCTF